MWISDLEHFLMHTFCSEQKQKKYCAKGLFRMCFNMLGMSASDIFK